MHLGQPRLSRITGPHAPNVPADLARQVRKRCGKDALPKEWDVFVQDGTVPDSYSLNTIAATLVRNGQAEALAALVGAAGRDQAVHLDLGGQGLDGESVATTLKEFVETVSREGLVLAIDLNSNRIGDREIEILAPALSKSQVVVALNLSNNPVGTEAAKYLAEVLHSPCMQRLDLSRCAIDESGTEALVECLRSPQRPASMPLVLLTNKGPVLSDGTRLHVSVEDLRAIQDAVSSGNQIQLIEQYMQCKDGEALTWLVHEAARTQQGFCLSLQGVEIDDKNVGTLFECLRKLPASTMSFEIGLANTGISSGDAIDIMDALTGLLVTELDLSGNPINIADGTGIADRLSRSRLLKRLLVDAAYLSDVGRSTLSNALSKSELIFFGGMRQRATSQVGETSTVAARVSPEAIATWQACRESLLPANTVSRSERLHLPPQEPAPQNVEVDLATMIELDLAAWALQYSLLLKAYNQRYMFTENLAAREREVRQGRKAQEGFPPPDLAQMADLIVRQGGENCYGHADWNFAMVAAKIRQLHEEHPELRPYLPDVFVATDVNVGDRLEGGGSADDGHQYVMLTSGNGSGKQLVLDSWVLYPMVHPFEDGDYKVHDVLDRYEAGSDLTARKRVVHPDILKRLDGLSQRNHDSRLLSREQYADQNHFTAAHWDVSYSYRPDALRCTYSCGSMVFDPDRVSENFELRINWGKQIDWMLQNIAKAPRLERAADLSPLRASDPLLKL